MPRKSKQVRKRGGRRGRSTVSNADTKTRMPMPMRASTSRRMVLTFTNYLTATSDGSGNINTYLAFDPSSTTTGTFGSVALFPEYKSYVTNLFARVKLKQFEIYLTSDMIDDTKGDSLQPLSFASTTTGTLATPGSYATVIDNGDSILWSPIRDYSGVAKYAACRPRSLGWGPTGSPGGTTAYGCPGSYVFYGAFGGFITATIFSCKIVGTYVFDTRI